MLGHETKQAWRRLIGRCLKPSYDGYNGARISERWLTYENFLADLGLKPGKTYEVARIDRSRPFEPGNVEWAEEGIEFEGTRRTVFDWATRLGMDQGTLYARLRKRWSVDRSFCQPLRGFRPGKHGQSIWALRANGVAEGITYENQLSSNYENMKKALGVWRELVDRIKAGKHVCRLELLRRAPTDIDWVEIVRFPR